MLSKMLELLGALCFLAFAYIVWPPAALALLGVLLVFAGYLASGIRIEITSPEADK